jgi:putative YhdH/YhfP family quinone oxidoreductase
MRFTAFRLHEGPERPEGRLVEMSVDELSPGEVTIRVAYSSLNYKDALAAAGMNKLVARFPRIGGIDLAGTVVASRDGRFHEGDQVIVHGFGIGIDHDGGHAQYARVAADWAMPLPRGLDLLEAATLGAAGYTAGLSLHLMELNGLAPDRGTVVVTGATGGVASVAIDMLAQRGYRVAAITGKAAEEPYLRDLGASEVLLRHDLEMGRRPLEKGRWAGAIDSVGGETLAWLTRTMQPEGVITSFGNAGGAELNTTVMPFILRGVRLLGINANSPMPLREAVWAKIAHEYRPRRLREIARLIELRELPEAMARMLRGESRGRTVIGLPTDRG